MILSTNNESTPITSLSALRNTQRAPKSCRNCAARKVRCDKSIPCLRCIRRGESESCIRETVIVRGQVTTGKHDGSLVTYDELVRENARLREALADMAKTEDALRLAQRSDDNDLYYEKAFFQASVGSAHEPVALMKEQDILLPEISCSDALIRHDEAWNSWVHYALEYPRFAREHSIFMDDLDKGVTLQSMDPLWLAIYFAVITAALLTMDEKSVSALHLPTQDLQVLQRNWYDASLLFLYKADFLRRTKIQTVQAIAILGMSYINFGDFELYKTMWACAVRISQMLGLNKAQSPITELSQEAQHRLWWTLVICDWMGGAPATCLIREEGFDIPLPMITKEGSVTASDGIQIHPVQYHIFMSRTAKSYHRFRMTMQSSGLAVVDIVRAADEELAELIDTLPTHLQADLEGAEHTNELEATYPWVRWQRIDTTLVLLYHRLRINCTLQESWMADPGSCASARAVCLRTARDIIFISQNWELPAHEKRQWPLALYLFCAATFFIREGQHGLLDQEPGWTAEVDKCIEYLDQVSLWNVMAEQASEKLQRLMHHQLPA